MATQKMWLRSDAKTQAEQLLRTQILESLRKVAFESMEKMEQAYGPLWMDAPSFVAMGEKDEKAQQACLALQSACQTSKEFMKECKATAVTDNTLKKCKARYFKSAISSIETSPWFIIKNKYTIEDDDGSGYTVKPSIVTDGDSTVESAILADAKFRELFKTYKKLEKKNKKKDQKRLLKEIFLYIRDRGDEDYDRADAYREDGLQGRPWARTDAWWAWAKRCDNCGDDFGWSSQEEMKTKVELLCECECKSVQMWGSLPGSETISTYKLGRMFQSVTSITAEEENLRFLCRAISSGALENVEVITLIRNIGDEGMVEFCNAVASGSLAALKELYLNGNKIGDAGMIEFSRAISSGSLAALKELYLSNNKFGDAGMIEVSRAIASGSLGALKTLDLSGNEITDKGMKAFAAASGSLGKLQILALDGNQIGNAGMGDLSRAIAKGSLASLSTLFVEDGPLGVDHPQLKAACQQGGITLE